MKKLLKDFKEFLTEAQMNDYSEGGTLSLYHYAPTDQEEIIVDPKYFADRAKRSSFTMREYETSTVPRTFWYVDLQQRERQVSSGRYLYRHPVYGLRKGMEWNEMLEHIRESYDGIFYSLSSFDVVSLFVPYDATRVSTEEQAQLQGE
jgi:hypothetical protein